MSAPAIYTTLVIDRQNGGLMSYGAIAPPPTGQRDKRWYLIKLAAPAAFAANSPVILTPATGLGVGYPIITVASKATPDDDDEGDYLLARATGSADAFDGSNNGWDASLKGYFLQVNFNTAELRDYMIEQGGDAVTVLFEIDWADGSADQPVTLVFGQNTPITINAKTYEGGGSEPSVNPGRISGTVAIPNGSSGETVTGLALADAPATVILTLQVPAGGLAMNCVLVGAATTDGFTYALGGLTDSANYKLHYQIIP